MNITVKKFGGSSIETIALIKKLAAKLAHEKRQGKDIVVVVSAMAKTTDHLFSLAHHICERPYQRELDMLVTAGERISMSLLSIALHENDVPAISFTGSQSGIITDNCHGNAKIINVNAFRIKEELAKGKIVIVAGYQGVSLSKEVTTLGRGGSDTTAVALAGFLAAEACEIYKDVDGVYSANPKIVPNALMYVGLSYQSMLTLSYCGCEVIHPRAVDFAMKYNIPLNIRSTFTDKTGTIVRQGEAVKEKNVNFITSKHNLLQYRIKCREPLALMKSLHCFNLYRFEIENKQQMSFMAENSSKDTINDLLSTAAGCEWSVKDGISSITFAGTGFFDDISILSDILAHLKDKQIPVMEAYTIPQGFTVYIKSRDTSQLIDELHQRFIIDAGS